MKYKLVYLCLFLLIIPIASAVIETTVSVTTYPDQQVTVNVLDPSSQDLITSFTSTALSSGVASGKINASGSLINLYVIARTSDGKIFKAKNFGNYTTGGIISLNILEDDNILVVQNITNSTIQNQTNQSQTNQTLTNSTTGSTTNSENNSKGVFSYIWDLKYYILGVIVAAIIVFVVLFLVKMRNSNNSYGKIKIVSQGSVKPENKQLERELVSAKSRIREMEIEMNKMKNRDRINDMEKKIANDRAELDRLRKGL
jgi:hypothetical protein